MTPISTLYPSHADTFPVPCPSPPLTRQQHTPPSLTLPSQPPLSNLSQTSTPPPHLPPPPPAPTGNERAKKTTSKPLHIPPLPQPTTSPFTLQHSPQPPRSYPHPIHHPRPLRAWHAPRHLEIEPPPPALRPNPPSARAGGPLGSANRDGPGRLPTERGGPSGIGGGGGTCRSDTLPGEIEIWLGLLWMGGNDAGGVEMYSCTVPGQIGKVLCVSELQLSREWWDSI